MAKVSRRSLLIGGAAAMMASPGRAVAAIPQIEITPTIALRRAARRRGTEPSSTHRPLGAWRGAAILGDCLGAQIPIVFVTPGDPVAAGLVASFARPGGNMTALTFEYPGVVR